MKNALVVDNESQAIWRMVSKEVLSKPVNKIILIIDDRFFVRVYVNKILDRPDYELHHATDFNVGLNYARIIKPDLIIFDFNQLKESNTESRYIDTSKFQFLMNTKFLCISRVNEASINYEILNSGIDDYINIPFSAVTLISKVSTLLSSNLN